MTDAEILNAIRASGITAEELATVLSFGVMTVRREQLASAIRAERTAQAAALQASEARAQALQAQLDAINAQLEANAH
jgi:hypothetical protein